jgi:hypothetical protein
VRVDRAIVRAAVFAIQSRLPANERRSGSRPADPREQRQVAPVEPLHDAVQRQRRPHRAAADCEVADGAAEATPGELPARDRIERTTPGSSIDHSAPSP